MPISISIQSSTDSYRAHVDMDAIDWNKGQPTDGKDAGYFDEVGE